VPNYIALHKPFGVLSSFTHEAGETEKRTLSEFGLPKGVYAAGRLDFDSEGLLILSDDGRFINALTDPSHKLPKTYWAQVEGVVTETALAELRHGVTIRTKGVTFTTLPCEARLLQPQPEVPARDKPITPHGPTTWIELQLTEGKKRQVRHMTAAVGLPTLRLLRVAIGPVSLGALQQCHWRPLAADEVATIMIEPRRNVAQRPRPQKRSSS
jgi:23S rRNA pseudouridine2457 synthase